MLFMLSSGLTLIFGMMGVLNFAHASFYMIGAYFAYQLSMFVGFWPALVIAPILVGSLGALVERYGLRKVHVYGHMVELILTFGVFYIIGEIVKLVWGKLPVDYTIPQELDFIFFHIYSTGFHAYKAFMMIIAIVMFIFLYLLIKKTTIGMVIQASLSNPIMVGELGHNVSRLFMGVFAAGSAMAALAGVISGNLYVTEPAMQDRLGLIIFVVVIVGGLGSITGALIASIGIGIIQVFATGLPYNFNDFVTWLGLSDLENAIFNIKLSQLAEMIPFLIMVLCCGCLTFKFLNILS